MYYKCGSSYLALKVIPGKLRQLRPKYSFVGAAFFDRLLVELVEAQVVDEHVQGDAHRPMEVAAALIVIQQGVERVPAALEEVLGVHRVVVLPPAFCIAEERARVRGQG